MRRFSEGRNTYDFSQWCARCWEVFFCNIVKEKLGINSYPTSTLISNKKNAGFDKNKVIPDIDINQQYFLAAVNELRSSSEEFILDGHFCLLNAEGEVTRIGLDTFTALHPEAILLPTEAPAVICDRRWTRGNIAIKESDVAMFQDEEMLYAQEVAAHVEAKLYISSGANDVDTAIEFLISL